MKSLILVALFAALPAMGAAKTEVIRTTGSVYIYGIQCIVRAGTSGKLEDRLFTQLGTIDYPPMILELKEIVTKMPKALTAEKCDLPALDLLARESRMYFGYFHGAPIEVTKLTKPSFVNGNKQCVAHFEETITVDLSGIVLTAKNYNLLAMDDCVWP